MKLEDIKVGQTVVDKFGNEYVVENVNHGWMPVYLRCTKFVKRVGLNPRFDGAFLIQQTTIFSFLIKILKSIFPISFILTKLIII